MSLHVDRGKYEYTEKITESRIKSNFPGPCKNHKALLCIMVGEHVCVCVSMCLGLSIWILVYLHGSQSGSHFGFQSYAERMSPKQFLFTF